jgi:hypothetical protein
VFAVSEREDQQYAQKHREHVFTLYAAVQVPFILWKLSFANKHIIILSHVQGFMTNNNRFGIG